MSNPVRTVIHLEAARKRSGEPVIEEVLVDSLSGNKYRVVATPGLVLGVAAGDVINVDHAEKTFAVMTRGGNLAIHLYGPQDTVNRYVDDFDKLGGVVDGRAHSLTVLTVPVASGWDAVEGLLNSISQQDPDVRWYYGNVYGEDGETPLGWWKD
jgi:hypothetical protein